jgi:hypothetical protein
MIIKILKRKKLFGFVNNVIQKIMKEKIVKNVQIKKMLKMKFIILINF